MKDHWLDFAEQARRSGAPLYARLAEGIAADDELSALASGAQPGQPHANLLLGAVHYLLLRGTRHPLRRHYPNLNNGQALYGDAHFQDFVASRRAEIAALIAARITNTNEVGRSALLHPGFREVAKASGEPLNLIEIGPSAGLNLLWDRYAICYRRGDKSLCTEPSGLALTIDCELRGDRVPPTGPAPQVASRVGLERHPVDLSRTEERDWLKALVWPDHLQRFARLEKALEIHRREPPAILAGNALTLLPEAIAAVPEDQSVCVYHSLVIYQFSEEMREAFNNLLIAASLRRPIWRLGLEDTPEGDTPLTLGDYSDGVREVRTLALCHSHGNWIDWRG